MWLVVKARSSRFQADAKFLLISIIREYISLRNHVLVVVGAHKQVVLVRTVCHLYILKRLNFGSFWWACATPTCNCTFFLSNLIIFHLNVLIFSDFIFEHSSFPS